MPVEEALSGLGVAEGDPSLSGRVTCGWAWPQAVEYMVEEQLFLAKDLARGIVSLRQAWVYWDTSGSIWVLAHPQGGRMAWLSRIRPRAVWLWASHSTCLLLLPCWWSRERNDSPSFRGCRYEMRECLPGVRTWNKLDTCE